MELEQLTRTYQRSDRSRCRSEEPTGGIIIDDEPDYATSIDPLCNLIKSVTPVEQVGRRARELLSHYLTFEDLMRAAEHDRPDEEILTDAERSLLRSVRDVSGRVLKEQAFRNRVLSDYAAFYDYLRITLGRERKEVTRVLFLDMKNRLIADELHSRGTVNHTPVYIRELLERIFANGAAQIVIVHNHPSGDPTPSEADVRMTGEINHVLGFINVKLIDHIVVGLREVASLKKLGYF